MYFSICNYINCSNISSNNSYYFIKTSTTNIVNNYNTSLVTFINVSNPSLIYFTYTSLGNSITKYNSNNLTTLKSNVQTQ